MPHQIIIVHLGAVFINKLCLNSRMRRRFFIDSLNTVVPSCLMVISWKLSIVTRGCCTQV